MDTKKILIVEDEGLVAEDIETTLANLGYEIVGVVMSGEKAVVKATEIKPDLVLMDIGLRGYMDGIDAAKKIHDRLKIPVLYLTAYGDDKTIKRAREAGPFGILSKPFDAEDLSMAIEQSLSKDRE